MQAIIAAIFVPILKWLLETGGRFLFEKINQIIAKHEQDKIDKKNLEDYQKAVKEKDLKKQADAIRKIANGEK